ncbi:hypothetical protein PRVXH_001594 [Proteinivorax hydrogeniformans]|uniref:Uncharacterized protein n=1 Tax=Proteinivorax hydrogeniformans TaxID=1826727 RepID=A0AAU8HQJ9_9FIRM
MNWEVLKFLIPVIISFLALALSFANYKQVKKRLEVCIEDKLINVGNAYENHNEFICKRPKVLFKGKACIIKIVNPSPNDIGYFDLRVIEKSNSSNYERLPYLHKNSFKLYDSKVEDLYFEHDGAIAKLNYPNSSYGTFKANTFTHLDIAFVPEAKKSEILVSFKVAIPSVRKIKNAGIRRKYRYYEKVFKYESKCDCN